MSTRKQVFELLSPHHFKTFLAAAETQNFTRAATHANISPSAVSLHIKALEDQTGVALFKRLGQQVKLTSTGSRLVAYIHDYQRMVDDFLDSVQNEEVCLKGPVTYAMRKSPVSC